VHSTLSPLARVHGVRTPEIRHNRPQNPVFLRPGGRHPPRLAKPADSFVDLCVFITAVPITKLFARGGGEAMEDMCYERLRAEACVM
jgi:hypothetical protein